jgi:hypothetical protein
MADNALFKGYQKLPSGKDFKMNIIKKTVGFAALVVMGTMFLIMPASAFFADNTASDASGMGQGKADVKSNAQAEGEATFSMSFTGKGKTKGDLAGQGNGSANAGGTQRDLYRPPYYSN